MTMHNNDQPTPHQECEEICPTMSTKEVLERFDVSRTDYIQALLQGDAALNQYLDPLHEKLMPTFQAYESPDEENDTERSVNPNLTNHPTLPLFPLVGERKP